MDAADPVTIPLKLVVTNGTVELYPDGCVAFPDAGACSAINDVGCGPPACISDMQVYLDDKIIASTPNGLTFAPVSSGQLSLSIAGCGHGAVRIPLGDAASFPTATATATISASSAQATWTTDSDEALVYFSAFGESALCRAQGVKTLSKDLSQVVQVMVEPLATPTQLDTAFGPTTIWHAGYVIAQ